MIPPIGRGGMPLGFGAAPLVSLDHPDGERAVAIVELARKPDQAPSQQLPGRDIYSLLRMPHLPRDQLLRLVDGI